MRSQKVVNDNHVFTDCLLKPWKIQTCWKVSLPNKHLTFYIIRSDISSSNIPEQILSCRLPKCRWHDEVSAEWSDVDRRHLLSTLSTMTEVKTCWRWGCTWCPRSTLGRCDLRVLSSPWQFTNHNNTNNNFRHKTSQTSQNNNSKACKNSDTKLNRLRWSKIFKLSKKNKKNH